MFNFNYDDWETVCKKIFSQIEGRKKYYLQWYPFYKLSREDEEYIQSKVFFDKFIQTGFFLFFKETWIICDNYLLKSDGTFRNASLISPLLYLTSFVIGKTISNHFNSIRPFEIIVYYAGNYKTNDYHYTKEYHIFYDALQNLSNRYQYFIKTDIKDFYPNIDINILFSQINERVNNSAVTLSQTDLMVYKAFLSLIGQGEFPLTENSIVSSYLATVIYLESSDIELYNYLCNKSDIKEFQMIRYVDDLYIFFDSDLPYNELQLLNNQLIYFYVSVLKKLKLSLNKTKTTFDTTDNIYRVLKKSHYFEDFIEDENDILDFLDENLIVNFLTQIEFSMKNYDFKTESYNEIIDKVFFIENIKRNPNEILNSLVYSNNDLFNNKTIISKFHALINLDYSFLKIDPKRFVILLLKTKDEALIKRFLSKLLSTNESNSWDIFDSTVAINYLLQRSFVHHKLLDVIGYREKETYDYYYNYCRDSFLNIYTDKNLCQNIFFDKYFFKEDTKLFFLFFLFYTEYKKENYLTAYAYFKNFFDRITAHFDFYSNDKKKKKEPNYKKFYEEKAIRNIYSDITNSSDIIKIAHEIRNHNPIAHAGSELMDNKNPQEDIINSINSLLSLIYDKIKTETGANNAGNK